MDPLTVLGALGAVLTLAVILGAAYAVIKTTAIKASQDLMATGNAELRAGNADLRRKIDDNATDHAAELARSERECAQQISRLEGRVQVLQDGFVADLGHALAESMRQQLANLVAELLEQHGS